MDDTSTFRVDLGLPFPVFEEGAEDGVVLKTFTCGHPSCDDRNLHLRAHPARRLDDGRLRVAPDPVVELQWDTETHDAEVRRIPGARDHVELEPIEAFMAEHAQVLGERYDRHREQARRGDYLGRPAPRWSPGDRVHHCDLFPGDFTPHVSFEGGHWPIADSYCPDPLCPCERCCLVFYAPDGSGDAEIVQGKLGASRPDEASRRGRALFRAVGADPELVAQLEARRAEVREAGPFVVACGYEDARRAPAPSKPTHDPPMVYLQKGLTPAWIDALFRSAGALDTHHHPLLPGCLVRAVVRGAVHGEAWVDANFEEGTIDLLRSPSGGGWLFARIETRSEAPIGHLLERCARGFPLVGAGRIPVVYRVRDEYLEDPSADELRLTIAVLSALDMHHQALERATDELLDGRPETGRLSSELTIDGEVLEVELVVSDPEAPWDHAVEEPGTAGASEGHEGEVDPGSIADATSGAAEETPQPEESIVARVGRCAVPAEEAFVDAALTQGESVLVARLGAHLLGHIAIYAAEQHRRRRWFDPEVFEAFLTRYAPRVVTLREREIDATHDALGAVVAWLRQVGHVDDRAAKALRRSLGRTAKKFRQRMREPERFGLAKRTFTEMMQAGVDVHDQEAIDAYLSSASTRV